LLQPRLEVAAEKARKLANVLAVEVEQVMPIRGIPARRAAMLDPTRALREE
jgi:hypothetical protein